MIFRTISMVFWYFFSLLVTDCLYAAANNLEKLCRTLPRAEHWSLVVAMGGYDTHEIFGVQKNGKRLVPVWGEDCLEGECSRL